MKTKALAIIAAMLALAATNLSAQPVIITQPTNQTAVLGSNVTFSVAASGTGPFSYRWQFNESDLPDCIITVAGNGAAGYSGDGGAATNASLKSPNGVVVDALGNLFIGDYANNRVRKVDVNGVITTIAGNGTATFSGDGGPATNAGVHNPRGVALDSFGNLFIADIYRIRKVDTNGIITTVAGNGSFSYSGDGGAATNASLGPLGVAVDVSANLFIADSSNYRIRKVDTNGIITTVAGNGSGGYYGDGSAATNANLYNPSGVATDASGNLFIADTHNNVIRKVDTSGIITTVAGNVIFSGGFSGDSGAATNANLNSPNGVTTDASGNLFIADRINNRIRKVDANGIITTVAGNGIGTYSGDGGAATNAGLSAWAVAVDAFGNLFIADANTNRIRKVGGLPVLTLRACLKNRNGEAGKGDQPKSCTKCLI